MDLRRFIEIGLKKNFVWVSGFFFFSQNKKSFLGFLKSSKLKIKKEKKNWWAYDWTWKFDSIRRNAIYISPTHIRFILIIVVVILFYVAFFWEIFFDEGYTNCTIFFFFFK